jgi:phosphoserine phosphatase RsbU/P
MNGMNFNILIVDDISENIQLLGSILGKQAYAVSFATHGAQALEMVAEENFDLILLDIMMPGMNGYEVCRQIQQMPDKRQIPIIFLTARTEKADIVKGFKAGAVDYVTKPFNAPELLARVSTHLELKRARDIIEARNREVEANNRELEKLNQELRSALAKIKTLEGILPICSFCKKIRDNSGNWRRVEAYFEQHSQAEFSHSICPDCARRHYPEFCDEEIP